MKRRWRRWGKWAGTVIALCIVAAWLVSGWYTGAFVFKGRLVSTAVACDTGLVGFSRSSLSWDPYEYLPDGASARAYHNEAGPTWSRRGRPRIDQHLTRSSDDWAWTCTIPLWNLLALVLLPTAFLWYRDRRHPPGCCPRCGYDLAGNSSGICPECGPPPGAQGKAEEARASSA